MYMKEYLTFIPVVIFAIYTTIETNNRMNKYNKEWKTKFKLLNEKFKN